MIDFLKKFKKWIFIILIGGSVWAAENRLSGINENQLTTSLVEQQEQFLTQGKYQYIPPTKAGDFTYQINEYKKPNGKMGYWIVLQKTFQVDQYNATTSSMEKVSKVQTKTIGFGEDALSLTRDWK